MTLGKSKSDLYSEIDLGTDNNAFKSENGIIQQSEIEDSKNIKGTNISVK